MCFLGEMVAIYWVGFWLRLSFSIWKVAVLYTRIFRRKIRRNKTSNDLYL